jgi:hypothetical protein
MSTFYVGTSADLVVGQIGNSRHFYALRRNDDGELFLKKIDQLVDQDGVELNVPGDSGDNFISFEEGIDFYDGIDEDHEPVFKNLVYPQYRWDAKSAYFYVDDQGQFVMRVNQSFTYPEGISS